MIPFCIYNKIFHLPESWNELTGAQLVRLSAILQKEELTLGDRLLMFRICTGMGWYYFHQLAFMPGWLSEKLYWKKAETMLGIHRNLHLLEFLTKGNTLTTQLLPRLGRFYGPESEFGNLTMKEFSYSELHYLGYREHKDRDSLVKLVATIYRPAKKSYDRRKNEDGDVRVPFNEHLVDHFAKQIRKMSTRKLLAVYYWYEGCRLRLIELFPKVFDGKESDLESFGLFSLVTNVAEDGVLGNFYEIQTQYVHVVLLRLTERINMAEYLEAEHQRQMEEMKNQNR